MPIDTTTAIMTMLTTGCLSANTVIGITISHYDMGTPMCQMPIMCITTEDNPGSRWLHDQLRPFNRRMTAWTWSDGLLRVVC